MVKNLLISIGLCIFFTFSLVAKERVEIHPVGSSALTEDSKSVPITEIIEPGNYRSKGYVLPTPHLPMKISFTGTEEVKEDEGCLRLHFKRTNNYLNADKQQVFQEISGGFSLFRDEHKLICYHEVSFGYYRVGYIIPIPQGWQIKGWRIDEHKNSCFYGRALQWKCDIKRISEGYFCNSWIFDDLTGNWLEQVQWTMNKI